LRWIALAAAGIALVFVADALVAARRAQIVEALLRRGMTGPEAVRAVGAWTSLLEAPGCIVEPALACRHIRLAVRGPLVATLVFDVRMDSQGRLEQVTQSVETWTRN
jgi:hypothetical protein